MGLSILLIINIQVDLRNTAVRTPVDHLDPSEIQIFGPFRGGLDLPFQVWGADMGWGE